MDVTSLSGALAVTNPNSDISVQMLAKNLDTFEEMGEEMTKMLELSVQPSIGSNFDVRC